MKRSLMCMLALVALSCAAHAQDTLQGQEGEKLVIKHPAHINAADRAEMKKGVHQVGKGMQGFFQALNDALNQAHRDREAADANKARGATVGSDAVGVDSGVEKKSVPPR